MSTAPTPTRTRLSPDARREQLLELGTKLLATRPLSDLSIELLAEEAGISRGLLYHYFGNKQEFHLAVCQRASEQLIAITAPRDLPDPFDQLVASLSAYVDYVRDNLAGYVSLVRAAAGGDEQLRAVYERARDALVGRIFDAAGPAALAGLGIEVSPATRMLAGAWAAMVEQAVIAWVEDTSGTGLDREDLLGRLVAALPPLLSA